MQNSSLRQKNRLIVEQVVTVYTKLYSNDYASVIDTVDELNSSILSKPLTCECMRIALFCHIQLVDDYEIIKGLSDSLFKFVCSDDFEEDELKCQSLLLLLNLYNDHLVDSAKATKSMEMFDKIQLKYENNKYFIYFDALYNRKAVLFHPPGIACECTKQAVEFFEESSNDLEKYYAYCNYLGNLIVLGHFEKARNVLKRCNNLMSDTIIPLPSQYKMYNNEILLEYLENEQKVINNKELTYSTAKFYSDKFEALVATQGDEVSHVISLNAAALKLMCNKLHERELESLCEEIDCRDSFYAFFIHDLRFAYFVISGKTTNALFELKELENIDVPLFKDIQTIIKERKCVQEEISMHPEAYYNDPYKYHMTIANRCYHKQDATYYFWGRGFLLSDLQFLSIN